MGKIQVPMELVVKSGLLVEIGHFEAFLANSGVTDLTLGHSRVAPKGFFLLYYPYPVPKLLAETFLGLGPDLVHLSCWASNRVMPEGSDWPNHRHRRLLRRPRLSSAYLQGL